MKKPPPPRTDKDFTIRSLEWECDIAARFQRAGFSVPADEALHSRFWIYLDFLQANGLTSRIIANKKEDVALTTALRNSDLTDQGFRFIQAIESKWSNRLLKYSDADAERSFLRKWLEKFRNEN